MGNMVPFASFAVGVIYHYLPALTIAVILGGLVFDTVLQAAVISSRSVERSMRLMGLTVLVLASAVFVHLSPWIYAFVLDDSQHASRMLFRSWDL